MGDTRDIPECDADLRGVGRRGRILVTRLPAGAVTVDDVDNDRAATKTQRRRWAKHGRCQVVRADGRRCTKVLYSSRPGEPDMCDVHHRQHGRGELPKGHRPWS